MQQQYLGKGLFQTAFPMNTGSIRDEDHVLSLRLVQRLSSGKSSSTVWSLAKPEEKSTCPMVWLIDVLLFSTGTAWRWQEVTLLLSRASLLPSV